MNDSGEKEIEELRDRLDTLEANYNSLEGKYADLEARYHAAMAKNDTLRDIVLGDYEAGENAVREAPSVWEQLADLRHDTTTQRDRISRLDSAGARGQPGAARKAKVRHALVKRATKRGTVSIAQAAQSDAPALDYEDVLALFDYEISGSYATKLLDKAADGSSAFWVKTPGNARDGRKTLRVDVTELDSDSPYLRDVRRGAESDSANKDFAELGNSEHREEGG